VCAADRRPVRGVERSVLIHRTGRLVVTIAHLAVPSIILANASRRLNLPPTARRRLSPLSVSQIIRPLRSSPYTPSLSVQVQIN